MPADTPMVRDPRLDAVMGALGDFHVLSGRVTQTHAAHVLERLDALSASPAREGDLGSSASPIPSDGLSGAAAAALRPCPFSGHTDSDEGPTQESGLSVERFKSPAGGFAYQVACCCGVRGRPERERGDAIHAWNVRAAPSPGEGDAPVAWRYRTTADHPAGPSDWVFCLGKPSFPHGVAGFEAKPLFTRPTPATPEGLREAQLRVRAEIDANAKAAKGIWRTAYGQGLRKALSILAALQPQAGEGE